MKLGKWMMSSVTELRLQKTPLWYVALKVHFLHLLN